MQYLMVCKRQCKYTEVALDFFSTPFAEIFQKYTEKNLSQIGCSEIRKIKQKSNV